MGDTATAPVPLLPSITPFIFILVGAHFQPSESYLSKWLLETSVSEEQLNRIVWPSNQWASLAAFALVHACLRRRLVSEATVLVSAAVAGLGTRLFLLFGRSLATATLSQFTYSVTTASLASALPSLAIRFGVKAGLATTTVTAGIVIATSGSRLAAAALGQYVVLNNGSALEPLFQVSAASMVVSLLATLLVWREAARNVEVSRPVSFRASLAALRVPGLLPVLFVMTALLSSHAMFSNYYQQLLLDRGVEQMGYAGLALEAAATVGALLAGFSHASSTSILALLAAALGGAILSIGIVDVSGTTTLVLLSVVWAGTGATKALGPAVMADRLKETDLAVALAAVEFAALAAAALISAAAVAAGMASTVGWTVLSGAVLAGVAGLVVMYRMKPSRSQQPVREPLLDPTVGGGGDEGENEIV
jgi:hypothetical protein